MVKKHFFIFIYADVVNPSFKSQNKTFLDGPQVEAEIKDNEIIQAGFIHFFDFSLLIEIELSLFSRELTISQISSGLSVPMRTIDFLLLNWSSIAFNPDTLYNQPFDNIFIPIPFAIEFFTDVQDWISDNLYVFLNKPTPR